MKIGVLGAGRMAEGLVPHWLRAGHEVMIGGRTPARTEELAERLRAGVEATLRDAGAADGVLRGKVLIESTNAIEHERMMVTTSPGASISEQIADATRARVVRAFNQVSGHRRERRDRLGDRRRTRGPRSDDRAGVRHQCRPR